MPSVRSRRQCVWLAVLFCTNLSSAILTGCYGGGEGSGVAIAPATAAPPTATVTPAATPSPAPTAAAIVLAPASLSFIALGAGQVQTFAASEAGFVGTFVAVTAPGGTSGSCSGIATVAPASSSGTFSVTPAGVGHCIVTIGDGTRSATETIDVTATSVGGN